MYYDGEALVISKENKLFCADSFYVDEDPIEGNIYKNIVEYIINYIYNFNKI